MIQYCKKCVMPATKPHLDFDDYGVCGACRNHAKKIGRKSTINWVERSQKFEIVVNQAKCLEAPYFDAMVPVSGGKDSITQVHRLLDQGLRILAVNVDYGVKTEVGIRNLEIIPQMGVSLLTLRPNLVIHKRLLRIGFEDYGDPDLLSHTMLHAFPLHMAIRFEVPLVLLGENSAFEYGGNAKLAESNKITREWFEIYAANSGVTATQISNNYQIEKQELWQYEYPEDLESSVVNPIFSSYYFPWDSEKHYEIAKNYGFESLSEPREGTYRTYVGIDEMINRVHQYLKVLKFGYGRATDHACEDIRAGRITREEGKKLVSQYDLQPLGNDYIKSVSEFLGYSIDEFKSTLERFRNPKLWEKDCSGSWHILDHLG